MARVYIAGKISGLPIEEAFIKFRNAELKLLNEGHTVINPMTLRHNHDKTWESYMRECVSAITTVDEVYYLPCWSDSKGAKIELMIAESLNIPTIPM